MRLQQVVSGGQTGADRAALDEAKALGLKTGGWAPKGYRTEAGLDPSLAALGLQEHPSHNYQPRTRANVLLGDATIIFGNPDSPGCKLTRRYCREIGRLCVINPDVQTLRDLAEEYACLNIAGNRESTNPGIYERTRAILREAWGNSHGA